jgi:hypothetical protein
VKVVALFAGLTSADIAAISILHFMDNASHDPRCDAAVGRMQQIRPGLG